MDISKLIDLYYTEIWTGELGEAASNLVNEKRKQSKLPKETTDMLIHHSGFHDWYVTNVEIERNVNKGAPVAWVRLSLINREKKACVLFHNVHHFKVIGDLVEPNMLKGIVAPTPTMRGFAEVSSIWYETHAKGTRFFLLFTEGVYLEIVCENLEIVPCVETDKPQ